MKYQHYEIARAAYESSPCSVGPFDELEDREKRQWLRVARAVVGVISQHIIPSWLETGEHWQDAVRDRLERYQ